MADLTPTSELDAVNIMLATIGEAPVSSLLSTSNVDLVKAKAILNEVQRSVLKQGWDFNTDIRYPLALDGDSKCPVPSDALSIDATYPSQAYVNRGGFLWDTLNHTAVLTHNPVYCDIVRMLAFDTLPEAARYYIAIRAARVFQRRALGDDSIEAYTQRDEDDARAGLMSEDHDSAERSLAGDYSVWRMTRYNRRAY